MQHEKFVDLQKFWHMQPGLAAKLMVKASAESTFDDVGNPDVENGDTISSNDGNLTPKLTAPPSFMHKTAFFKTDDLNSIVSVQGVVLRTGSVQIGEERRQFMCTVCHSTTWITADRERNEFVLPACSGYRKCSIAANGKQRKLRCKSIKLVATNEPPVHKNLQLIKVQQRGTSVLSNITVELADTWVNCCKPGEEIEVVGRVRRRWGPAIREQHLHADLYIEASSVSVHSLYTPLIDLTLIAIPKFEAFWTKYQHCPFQGREHLIGSVAPQLYGMRQLKLAVLLTLIGGVAQQDETGNIRIRGDSHLLLIGSPGLGKSQIMRWATQASVKGIMTNGVGSSSAGLTISATRDASNGGQWTLDAGALVLADGGVCCIDEFGSMSESDRVTIHDAMEQQMISTAKAGILSTLNTRCSVIAALNFKVPPADNVDLTNATGLSSPLLSRFDLIMSLLDERDAKKDAAVAAHLLRRLPRNADARDAPERSANKQMLNSFDVWSMQDIKAYISHVKQTRFPCLDVAAQTVLKKYYANQRCLHEFNFARTTVRLLESLVRLAQAHARLMYRDVATVNDAVEVCFLIEQSTTNIDASYSGACSELNSFDASDRADEIHSNKTEQFLRRLGLHEILNDLQPKDTAC